MNKYEWLWKTLQKHKRDVIDKLESKGLPVPIQHTSTLDLMKFLELQEPNNNVENRVDISINILRGMAEKPTYPSGSQCSEHDGLCETDFNTRFMFCIHCGKKVMEGETHV